MSLVTPTFERFVCKDCGHESQGANLKSFNAVAPPPENYSYDGSCVKCGSSNTIKVGIFEGAKEINQT